MSIDPSTYEEILAELKKVNLPRNSGNEHCTGEWDLVMGDVYGFRSWNRDKLGRLVSPQQSFLWKPGVNRAFDSQKNKFYGSPDGFYAYYDKSTFGGKVDGVIRAFGHVNEGTRGFNAEFAEIVAVVDNTGRKGPFGYLVLKNWWADKYAASRFGTFFGYSIVFAILGIFATIAGFTFVLGGFPAFGVLAALGLFIILNAVASATGEMMVDDHSGGKNGWQKYRRSPRFSLGEIYPGVKVYRSKFAMERAYRKKIEEGRPNRVEDTITPQDDRFWEV